MGKPRTSIDIYTRLVTLRKSGHSIKEIAKELSLSVSTVSKYTTKISLNKEARKILEDKKYPAKKASLKQHREARSIAEKIIGNLSDRDKQLIAIALYWGEGTKRELNIINGDPNLIKTFLNGLLLIGVAKNDVKIHIRYFSNQDKTALTQFWLKHLNIEDEAIIGYEKVASNHENKLEYGMCRLRVAKGGLYHKILLQSMTLISSGSSTDRTEAS